jgi:hypothetical protein
MTADDLFEEVRRGNQKSPIVMLPPPVIPRDQSQKDESTMQDKAALDDTVDSQVDTEDESKNAIERPSSSEAQTLKTQSRETASSKDQSTEVSTSDGLNKPATISDSQRGGADSTTPFARDSPGNEDARNPGALEKIGDFFATMCGGCARMGTK